MDHDYHDNLGCLEDVYVVVGDKKNKGLKHFFKVTDRDLKATLKDILPIPTKTRTRRGQKISYISPEAMISLIALHFQICDILPIFQKLICLMDRKTNHSTAHSDESKTGLPSTLITKPLNEECRKCRI